MRQAAFGLLALLLIACSQTEAVYDPANNKVVTPTTTPTSGTLTLKIALADSNHASQPISALLFQNGILKAAQYDTATTDGSKNATIVMKSVSTANCPTATDASLTNGTYDLYFSVKYATETRAIVNTGPTAGSCGANGYIDNNSGVNLYGTRASVTINGDTSYTLNSTNVALLKQHTFDFSAATSGDFRCYVTDANGTAYSATTHWISYYTRAGLGTTTGRSGATNLLPIGTYRYFCYNDAQPNGNFFETGTDKYATGTFSVTGESTTYIVGTSFSTL